MDCIICRYGELALKGKNRGVFERRLADNIRDCLRRNSIEATMVKVMGRIFVFTRDTGAIPALRRVFGLVSISPAVVVDADKERIRAAVAAYLQGLSPGRGASFRITSRRANKSLPFDSRELNAYVGRFIEEGLSLEVDLENPSIEIGIELHDRAFIFHETLRCFGGLPLGTGGRVACLVEDEKGILAAWLMMRRGVVVFPLVLGNVDLSLLRKYDYGVSLAVENMISIDEINGVIEKHDCKALVVGDTLDDRGKERYGWVDSVVLYPLVSYGDKEIKDLLARIIWAGARMSS
jgi:tRNA uracil 4-sulfurtransferase